MGSVKTLITGLATIPKYLRLKRKANYKILNFEDTLDFVIKNKVNLARLGDGELSILTNAGGALYQNTNQKLESTLREILKSNDYNDGLAVVDIFDLKSAIFKKRIFFLNQIHKYGEDFIKLVDSKTLLNTEVTRFYWERKPIKGYNFDSVLNKFRDLFKNKRILLVEGKYSNFSKNLPLLDGCKINRILVPEVNAFNKYEDIKVSIEDELLNKNYDLVLLACGATATVLASKLRCKQQVIDIGNLDSEYWWYKHNVKGKKQKIDGKYLLEADANSKKPEINLTNVVKVIEVID